MHQLRLRHQQRQLSRQLNKPIQTITFLFSDEYGGFSFSEFFVDECKKRLGITPSSHSRDHTLKMRANQQLNELVRELGSKKCSGRYAQLTIAKIPKEMKNFIHVKCYDGKECLVIQYEHAIARIAAQLIRKKITFQTFKRKYARIIYIKKNFELDEGDDDEEYEEF